MPDGKVRGFGQTAFYLVLEILEIGRDVNCFISVSKREFAGKHLNAIPLCDSNPVTLSLIFVRNEKAGNKLQVSKQESKRGYPSQLQELCVSLIAPAFAPVRL